MHNGKQVIVDYGCGAGEMVLAIAKWCPKAKIYAIDPNLENRLLAKNNLKKANLQNQIVIFNKTIETFKVPKGKPDILFFNFALEHIAKKDDLSDDLYFQKYFSEALDELEDDSSVYIRLWPDEATSGTFHHGRWRKIDDPKNVKIIKKILEDKGFEVVVDIVDLGQQEALVKGRVLNARQIEVLIETGEDPFLYPVSPFTLDAGKQYFVKIVARRGKYTKRKLRLLKKSSKLKKLLKEY